MIKKIKTGKGVGHDLMTNEMLNITLPVTIPCILKLFNLYLDSGIYQDSGVYPDTWAVGHIIPIYKSGSNGDTDNYRPVTEDLLNDAEKSRGRESSCPQLTHVVVWAKCLIPYLITG